MTKTVAEETLVVFHADVGRAEGWGHLRECLSVAAALRERGIGSAFVLPAENGIAKSEVERQGYASHALPASTWQSGGPLDDLEALLREIGASHVVADLVTALPQYAEAIARVAPQWAAITELEDGERAALSFNISRDPQYMPLDAAYRGRPARVAAARLSEVLVCFGGSDPKNVTGLVLEQLRYGFEVCALGSDVHVTVVLGPLFEHAPVIHEMPVSYPVSLSVAGPLAPAELAERALKADVAVTTGGGTMYEFCALGLPSVVVPILEKQAANAHVLERKQAVSLTSGVDRLSAGELIEAVSALGSREARQAMADAAQAAIDGRGAERIAERLVREWGLG